MEISSEGSAGRSGLPAVVAGLCRPPSVHPSSLSQADAGLATVVAESAAGALPPAAGKLSAIVAESAAGSPARYRGSRPPRL